jgi:hypothetical protein
VRIPWIVATDQTPFEKSDYAEIVQVDENWHLTPQELAIRSDASSVGSSGPEEIKEMPDVGVRYRVETRMALAVLLITR